MPGEREELRLTVTLVDNASAGLAKLKTQFNEMTNLAEKTQAGLAKLKTQFNSEMAEGPGKGAAEKFKKENAEISNVMKKVTGDAGEVAKAFGMMRLGALGAVGGIALLGYEVAKSIKDMGELADKVRAVNQVSRAFGIPPETLRNIQEQLEVVGVSAEESLGAITGFMDKMGELQRNPAVRAGILRETAEGFVPEMEKVLQKLNDAKGAVEKLNVVRQAGIDIEQQALKRGESPERAAGERTAFEQLLGYRRSLSQAGELKDLTEEQRKLEVERNKNLEHYANLVGEIKKEWGDIGKLLSDPAFAEDGPVVKGAKALKSAIESIKNTLEFIKREGLVTYLNPFSEGSRARAEKQFQEMLRKKHEAEEAAKAAAEAAKPPEQRAAEAKAAADAEAAREELRKWRETHPFGLPPSQRSTPVSPDFGGKPMRFMSGDGGDGGGPIILPGSRDDFLRNAPMSTNIEDRRGDPLGGDEDDRDRKKYMSENTAELKRLNDYLVDPSALGPGGRGGLGLFSGGTGGGGGLGTGGGGGGGGLGGGTSTTGGGGGLGTGLGGGTSTTGGGGRPSGGGGGGGGGGDEGGNDLDRGAYEKMFKGTQLENQYDNVVAAAQQNGVPPSTMAAIMAHETGRGTSAFVKDKNNPAGLMDPKTNWRTGQSFKTIEEGIAAAGRTIGKNYKSGGGTIQGMQKTYAPIGAANDPRGLNKDWAPGINSLRTRLQGPVTATTASPTGYTGVGGYNFMGSERARAMGMGDVTQYGPNAQISFPTGIPKGEGPQSIKANKYAGEDMAGFLKDLHAAGAPLGDFAGAYVQKPRQHGYGNALDIETGFGSGPDNSKRLYAWAQAHPKEFAEIQARHHMRNLDPSSGSTVRDWGHFEWTPTGRATKVAGRGGDDIDPAKSREAIDKDRAQRTTVEGSGKITVDVNAPKGTNVGAEASGLFKEVAVNRQTQMEPARRGPEAGEE